ncbi:MAG: YesL family protein [Bacillota bacterium]
MIETARNSLYRVLEIFTAFLLLNIVWLLFCLLIIPIYPATVAMFGVVRKWKTEGIDYGSVKPFLKMLKENWQKSFLVGGIWSLIGMVLLIDFYFLNQVQFEGKLLFMSLLLFCGMIYLFTTIYLFPILANYELPINAVLKNSLLLSIGRMGTTLLCSITIAAMIVAVYFIPLLFLVSGSLLAFLTYSMCSKSFEN